MATLDLPRRTIDREGTAKILTSADSKQADPAKHHVFANDGRVLLIAHNTGSTEHTVNQVIQKPTDGVIPAPKQAVLAANGTEGDTLVLGLFDVDIYNVKGGDDDGKIYIDCDSDEIYFDALQLVF